MDEPNRRAQAPHYRHTTAGAFTLVEIMIVVVIIGLLAAMAIPAFQRVRDNAKATRVANDFHQFEASFQRYIFESGSVPPAAAMGVIPTGMDGYLPAGYTEPSSLGGGWLWSGPSSNIVLRAPAATDQLMTKVDAILDDGDLTTGSFTKIAAGIYGLRVQ